MISKDKNEIYDVSPKQREVIEWRAAKRRELRERYLRQALNPTKQQMITDEAVQRFTLMRIAHEYVGTTTFKNFSLSLGTVITCIGLLTWGLHVTKEEREHQYRTGQVSYADRKYKFQ